MSEQLGFTRPGGPSVGTQIGGVVKGTGVTVAATVIGRVVANETGSETAGTATTVTVGVGGAVVITKLAGGSVVKSVGGGLLTGVAGNGTRAVVRAAGGSETAGDVSGYYAAGLTGAAFGGPIGAGGAVVVMAAADGASAGVDWYYAVREGESLEEKRQLLIVADAFSDLHLRNLNKNPVANVDFWKKIAAKPGGDRAVRALIVGGSTDTINEIYRSHLGRDPTNIELDAAQGALVNGDWLGEIEKDVMARAAAGGR